ncbi:hypothetical protein CCP3SC15_400017 [Gammaproteobacteria bacterium]
MTRDELNAEMVIKAIADYKGNVSMVARHFGMSRQTLYKYINDRVTVQAALAEARDTMIDNVESALYSAALAGEGWAVCFFLKTQGKSRGYVERNEITGADGGAITWRQFVEGAHDDANPGSSSK